MRQQVLIDTSAIVAILSGRDQHHETCRNVLDRFSPSPLTCWLVITEAQWLLRNPPFAIDKLFEGLEGGLWSVSPQPPSSYQRLRELLDKYSDIGAQLADVSLLDLAESLRIETIFTLDSKDFQVYRLGNQQPLRIVPEPY